LITEAVAFNGVPQCYPTLHTPSTTVKAAMLKCWRYTMLQQQRNVVYLHMLANCCVWQYTPGEIEGL